MCLLLGMHLGGAGCPRPLALGAGLDGTGCARGGVVEPFRPQRFQKLKLKKSSGSVPFSFIFFCFLPLPHIRTETEPFNWANQNQQSGYKPSAETWFSLIGLTEKQGRMALLRELKFVSHKGGCCLLFFWIFEWAVYGPWACYHGTLYTPER